MPEIKITLIQSDLYWENKEKNLAMFSEKISSIKEETDLIILPEMFSTGFTMHASGLAEKMDGKIIRWMQNESAKKNCVITGSVIIEEDGNYYNRLVWMRPDGFSFYDKRHLFSFAGEGKVYAAGKNKIMESLKGFRILPLICFDLRFPVWSRRTKESDYDLLIYTANWPERRVFAWKQLLIARAIENQCYVVGLNRTGTDGNNIFHSGDSAVIDFRGEKLNNEITPEEFIRTFHLSTEPLFDFRKQFAFFDDADAFKITGL